MNSITENLMRDEKIVYSTKLHWSIYILPVLLIPFYGIGLIFLLLVALERNSSHFVVTNKRVICQTGLLRKQSLELPINKIESVGLETGMVFSGSRGTITINGAGGTRQAFHNVSDPKGFRRAVNEVIANG